MQDSRVQVWVSEVEPTCAQEDPTFAEVEPTDLWVLRKRSLQPPWSISARSTPSSSKRTVSTESATPEAENVT